MIKRKMWYGTLGCSFFVFSLIHAIQPSNAWAYGFGIAATWIITIVASNKFFTLLQNSDTHIKFLIGYWGLWLIGGISYYMKDDSSKIIQALYAAVIIVLSLSIAARQWKTITWTIKAVSIFVENLAHWVLNKIQTDGPYFLKWSLLHFCTLGAPLALWIWAITHNLFPQETAFTYWLFLILAVAFSAYVYLRYFFIHKEDADLHVTLRGTSRYVEQEIKKIKTKAQQETASIVRIILANCLSYLIILALYKPIFPDWAWATTLVAVAIISGILILRHWYLENRLEKTKMDSVLLDKVAA